MESRIDELEGKKEAGGLEFCIGSSETPSSSNNERQEASGTTPAWPGDAHHANSSLTTTEVVDVSLDSLFSVQPLQMANDTIPTSGNDPAWPITDVTRSSLRVNTLPSDWSGWPSLSEDGSIDKDLFQPISRFERDFVLNIIHELDLNMYFQEVHPHWPFLRENVVRKWFDRWVADRTYERPHHGFFIHLVCATGALLSSTTTERDCPQLSRAQSLYERSCREYISDITQQTHLVQMQASLLLIMYAIHAPSLIRVHEILAAAATHCVKATSHLMASNGVDTRSVACSADSSISGDETTSRTALVACYTAYEIISTGWDRKQIVKLCDLDRQVRWDTIQLWITCS